MDLLLIIVEVLLLPMFWICLTLGGIAGLAISALVLGEVNPDIVATGIGIGGIVGLIISLDRRPTK